MSIWNEYPFVRLLFAFLGGILLYLIAGIHLPVWVLFSSSALALSLHLTAKNKTIRLYRYAGYVGLSFQLSLFAAGNILMWEKTDINDPLHFTHFDSSAGYAIVRITEPIIEKEKSYKIPAEVLEMGDEKNQKSVCGKTILYFQKNTDSEKLAYGNVLVIKNNFQPVTPPKNPDEFNYKRYLYYREIYKTAFLSSNDWALLPQKRINPLFQFTYWLRDVSLNAFKQFIPTEREAAVDEALVIGFRDDMSPETMQSYTAAGVVHVLAVSGLHVGIVFAFLHQLLFFLNRKKGGKTLQAVIIVTIIWLFALLTGLTGSVVRAATMFSFITLGKNMKRTISMNNMLACSALFILLINPLLITDVGFQLSYIAVFGITSLTSYINNWLYRENKIVDYIWKMISMSIAAQLATLPITVFYFNQFPTYFLLANLLVIPAAGIILHLGIALIVFQFLAPAALVIGKITGALTWLLNEYILRIQQLPFSVLHLPAMNIMQALLLALSIILISAYFINLRKKWLLAGLAGFFIIVVFHSAMRLEQQHEKVITLYSMRGKSNLEFRNGGEAVLFQCSSSLSSGESLYLQRHWQLNNITQISQVTENEVSGTYLNHQLYKQSALFQFYNYRIAVVREPVVLNLSDQKVQVDALIISANPQMDIKTVLSYYVPKLIIFDANNSRYVVKKWKQEAERLGVKTFDVNTDGAFIVNI